MNHIALDENVMMSARVCFHFWVDWQQRTMKIAHFFFCAGFHSNGNSWSECSGSQEFAASLNVMKMCWVLGVCVFCIRILLHLTLKHLAISGGISFMGFCSVQLPLPLHVGRRRRPHVNNSSSSHSYFTLYRCSKSKRQMCALSPDQGLDNRNCTLVTH